MIFGRAKYDRAKLPQHGIQGDFRRQANTGQPLLMAVSRLVPPAFTTLVVTGGVGALTRSRGHMTKTSCVLNDQYQVDSMQERHSVPF